MNGLIAKLKHRRGQVALEVLVVIAAWWFLIILFINVMIALSSMMVVQSTVNRLAVQVGAMGCYPERQFEADLGDNLGGFGASGSNPDQTYVVERSYWPVKAVPSTSPPARGVPASAQQITTCQARPDGRISQQEGYVPSDSYVNITLRYKQKLIFFSRQVTRSATTVSSRLEQAP